MENTHVEMKTLVFFRNGGKTPCPSHLFILDITRDHVWISIDELVATATITHQLHFQGGRGELPASHSCACVINCSATLIYVSILMYSGRKELKK